MPCAAGKPPGQRRCGLCGAGEGALTPGLKPANRGGAEWPRVAGRPRPPALVGTASVAACSALPRPPAGPSLPGTPALTPKGSEKAGAGVRLPEVEAGRGAGRCTLGLVAREPPRHQIRTCGPGPRPGVSTRSPAPSPLGLCVPNRQEWAGLRAAGPALWAPLPWEVRNPEGELREGLGDRYGAGA